MSDFRKKLEEVVINPAGHLRRTFTIVGTVTKSDEKNNICSVEFVDMKGYKSNKDNVPVKIYNQCIIDWFPKAGEMVNIDITDSKLVITSKYEGGYGADVRSGTKLKKDVLSNSFVDTIGGFIF